VRDVRYWQERDGIDDMLPNFAEYVAKIAKREFHAPDKTGPQGLMLIGGTGCGKTKRIDFIARRLNVHFTTAKEMVGDIGRHPENVELFRDVTRTGYVNCINNRRYNDLIIDDLGVEESETVSYGTRRDIMENIILARHKAFLDAGHLTHFTTNLSVDMIAKRYGDRILSRLREMCVFIVMRGGDRRQARQAMA